MYFMICYKVNFLLLLSFKQQLFSSNQELNVSSGKDPHNFEIISQFESYLAIEEQQLKTIKLKVYQFHVENIKACESAKNFFSNFINIFRFTKRLSSDWKNIDSYIANESFVCATQSFKNNSKFPTFEQLTNSFHTLTYLQDVYILTTSSLVRGRINGKKYNTSVTVEDCFDIGFVAYKVKDYYHTILWMNEALNQIKIHKMSDDQLKRRTLKILSETHFRTGEFHSAVRLSNEAIKLTSDAAYKKKNQFYKKHIHNSNDNDYFYDMYNRIYSQKNYALFCRDEQIIKYTKSHTLYCHYINNNIPYLYIGPFKQEILNTDPFVAIFHDVLFDNEIEKIKNISKHNLSDSTVRRREKEPDLRTSKTYTFQNEPNFVTNILKRAADMTSLNEEAHDLFHVSHYQVGEYYTPHYDFIFEFGFAYNITVSKVGNRISTIMFYMNNVEQGGATIFPYINLTVWPIKGSALFWFNLYSSGEYDLRTQHAACPVLVGHKWISTVWFFEKYQDIYRPCTESSRQPVDEC